MEINYAAIGMRIREARRRKKWTQAALAERAGIEPSNLSHIERAATKLSLPTLMNIANALEMTLDELVSDSLIKSATVSCKRIDDLLADCTDDEIESIAEMAAATKRILRKNK